MIYNDLYIRLDHYAANAVVLPNNVPCSVVSYILAEVIEQKQIQIKAEGNI